MKQKFTQLFSLIALCCMGTFAYAQPSVSNVKVQNLDTVTVEFSDFVMGSSASDASNYEFIPSSSISSVSFDSMSKTVSLVTSLSSGMYYSLAVSKVKDAAGTPMSMADTTSGLVYNTYSGSDIVISEILYNDSSGPDAFEFLEFYNAGSADIEVGGLYLTQGVTYTFQEYTFKAGSAVFIAKNPDSTSKAFNATALGKFGGGLSNSGEDIEIRNSMGDVLDFLDFEDNTLGWDARADGKGPSLQLKSYKLNTTDNDNASSWNVDYSNAYVNSWGTTYATPGWISRTHAPIGEITTVDADGVNPSSGAEVSISGTVYGLNYRSSGLQITVRDATGGIGTIEFSKDWGYTVNEGDSVWVSGKVDQYRGLSQLGSMDTIYKIGSGTLNDSKTVTNVSEATESDLVTVYNLEVLTTDATWGGNKNYNVTNGTDTFAIRIDRDTDVDGESILSGKMDITGIGGQFDPSKPYTSGYQLLPRYKGDIVRSTGGPQVVLNFAGSAASIDENSGSYNLDVSIFNANTNETAVDITVVGGTAVAGTDFTFTSPTTAKFPASNSDNQTATITIIDNGNIDSDRTIEFKLSNATNSASLGADSMFTLTIVNDDLAITEISKIRENDSDEKTLMDGQRVRVKGTVYGVNLRGSGLQFTLRDNSGGIGIIEFSKDFGYTVKEGDEVELYGTVGFYNGLAQIGDLDTLFFENMTNTIKNPVVVTMLGENTESDLISIERVWFVEDLITEWPNNGNIDITNGNDTFIVRIDGQIADLAGVAVPSYDTMNITGLGGQFDPSAPYNSGYQIFPRYISDIEEWKEGVGVIESNFISAVYPNPTTGLILVSANANINSIVVLNSHGQAVETTNWNTESNNRQVDLTDFGKGLYFISVNTELGSVTKKVIVK